MKLIKTVDAAGTVLCHDITQIITGVKKGPVFKKGHIIRKEDIPVLLSCGKENLYVWEKREGVLHEDEAAGILKDICIGDSDRFNFSAPSEGKIEIRAAERGLLKIRRNALNRVNSVGEMMIASVHGDFPVNKGDKIAATRIIPLVIEQEKMDKAVRCAGDEPVFSLLPMPHRNIGIVTTGSEVCKGLIKDAFGPVLREKLSEYDTSVTGQIFTGDDIDAIVSAIEEHIGNGSDIVIVSGGMSVDPDDRTPGAIKATGADIVTYGAPILPGAMFLLAYLERNGRTIPVMGLPGCVMYAKRTVFDLILPRILAGERLTADDINIYGEGGLCLSCEECTFPHCGFGK
ncbi:MAG: molybdopterin-binding protein [Oscillospiraceae bacterium]|nr:molybdopterin-binding protein [Oscillospiraceae bacterium]